MGPFQLDLSDHLVVHRIYVFGSGVEGLSGQFVKGFPFWRCLGIYCEVEGAYLFLELLVEFEGVGG